MPREKQRTPELQAHVLQVGIALLARDGVEGFTTRKVAQEAYTSTPAVYELFGDKAGLVQEIFFEGFRLLRAQFELMEETADPVDDLIATAQGFREFAHDHSVLSQVMFARPFNDFDPAPSHTKAAAGVRQFIVGRVRRAIDAERLSGNETDIAHVFLALAQGLATQEVAGWLGSSKASRDRRWDLATRALLDGLSA